MDERDRNARELDGDGPRPGDRQSDDPDTAAALADAPDIGGEAAPSRTDPPNTTIDRDTDDGPHDPTAV